MKIETIKSPDVRNTTIDILKGFGIFLVVAGHAVVPFGKFLFLFHVLIFFIASGYFYNDKYSETKKNLLLFIKKRIKSLWLTYVAFSLFLTLSNNLFIRLNIYCDENIEITAQSIQTSNFLTFKDMLRKFLNSLVFKDMTVLNGSLWFIKVLFEICILFSIAHFLINKLSHGNKTKIIIIQSIVSLLLFVVGYLSTKYWDLFYAKLDLIYNWDNRYYDNFKCFFVSIIPRRAMTYYFLYFSGYLLKLIQPKFAGLRLHYYLLSLVFSGIVLYFCREYIGRVEIGALDYKNPLYLIVISLFGWIFSYSLAYSISKINIAKWVFCIMGRHTLSILAWHLLLFKIVTYIGILINSQPVYLLASVPVLYQGKFVWFAYSAISIFISVLIGLLWNQIKAFSSKKYLIIKSYLLKKPQ